jgi:hypothetical protein
MQVAAPGDVIPQVDAEPDRALGAVGGEGG